MDSNRSKALGIGAATAVFLALAQSHAAPPRDPCGGWTDLKGTATGWFPIGEFHSTLVSAKRFFDPDHFIRLPEGIFYATDAVTGHALQFLADHRKENTPALLG